MQLFSKQRKITTPQKGQWVELSSQDKLQGLGRAVRSMRMAST